MSSTEEVDRSDAGAQPLSASLATVYEASPRVGGRMHSDTMSWSSGQVTEHCGELIDSTHKTILGLAKRFRIGVADLVAAEPTGSTDTNFFFGADYTTAQADADFAPVYDALKRDVRAAGFPTLYTSFTQAGFDLDHLSIYDWIESRVPGGHGSAMGQLLDVEYNAKYGADTTDQSSLNLMYLRAYQSAAIPSCWAHIRTGKLGNIPSFRARSASVPATAISPANTARSTFRASWKARPRKARAPGVKYSPTRSRANEPRSALA